MRFLFLILLVCLCSCRERKNDFTLVDFAKANGANFWKIQIPHDLKDDEYLATAWFRSAKFIHVHENLGSFAPGSVVKAFAFQESRVRDMKFTLLGRGRDGIETSMWSSVEPFEGYFLHAFHRVGETVPEGATLLTFDRGAAGDDDTCELRLVRQKRAAIPEAASR